MSSSFTGKTAVELESWLRKGGINTSLYGKGASKSVDLLLLEVLEAESALSLDGTSGLPVRDVSVVNVNIEHNKRPGLFLIETKQILSSGNIRDRNLPLSEKMLPNEHWRDAVVRGIKEELGPVLVDADNAIVIDEQTYTVVQEKKESQSYPGLQTRYSCHRVNAVVNGLPDDDFETKEERADGHTITHMWEWKP